MPMQHDRRQSQAESPLEVSHLDFLLLNFEPEGRTTPLSGEETMHISGDRDIKGGETESKGYYGKMAKMIATVLNQGADVDGLYVGMNTGLTDVKGHYA